VNTDDQWGLSIVVCCFNSAERLPETLAHLTRLQINAPWEVLIVNNASTDNTAKVAEAYAARLPLCIVNEQKPGLTQARHRGLREARYAILGFIDDDNHVPPDWGANLLRVFAEHPRVAAAGGPISEVCEIEPPWWFEKFKGNYTIWAPHETARVVNHPLCGAGLGIRKAAWAQLRAKGFVSLLSDRKGGALSSGGDFELCYAFMLAGWQLYYDPALQIRHFIPKSRLNWDYLCRLNEGFGRQSVVLDSYAAKLKGLPPPRPYREIFKCLKTLLRHFPNALRHRVGDAGLLLWLSQKGRMEGLCNSHSLNIQKLIDE